MAVEDITLRILGHVLYWSRFVVSIALIYAIVKLFIGGEGGNPFSGWGSTGGGTGGGKEPDPNSKNNEGDGSIDEKQRFIDFDNLAKVKFLVRNLDDGPVHGATVLLYPSKARWFFKKYFKYGRNYGGKTNKDGIWPSHGGWAEVPSGTLKYVVTYELPEGEAYKARGKRKRVRGLEWKWKASPGKSTLKSIPDWGFSPVKRTSPYKHPTRFEVKKDIELSPGENDPITVVLDFYGEYSEAFEPHIKDVKREEGGDGPELHARGVIKPL